MQFKRDQLSSLRHRSESEALDQKKASIASQSSLPRGEYLQHVMGPKMNKNSRKLEAINYRKVSGDVDSADLSTGIDNPKDASDSGYSDSSEENTPVSTPKKKPSQFSRMSSVDAGSRTLNKDSNDKSIEKPAFHTPVVSRRRVDLYKVSILSKFAKPSAEAEKDEEKKNIPNQSNKESEQNDKTRDIVHKSLKHCDSAHFLTSDITKDKSPSNPVFNIRKLAFSPNVDIKLLKKHCSLLLRGLNYSLNLLKGPPLSYIQSRQIVLKENKKKSTKTLILDLDETLITSCSARDDPDKVLIPEGDESAPPIMIKIRPYCREFLKKMKEHYEIIIFTASTAGYAETIIKELDPQRKYISYILDRNFCLETKNGFYIKDLRIIKNRQLKNMIIVDNLVHSFGFQIDNGIPILEWTGNKQDEELRYLMDYLIEAKKYDDVREYNKEKLKLVELANSNIDEFLLDI